jgi:hypothetical protein
VGAVITDRHEAAVVLMALAREAGREYTGIIQQELDHDVGLHVGPLRPSIIKNK